MTPAEIVEGLRQVQARLRELTLAAQAIEGSPQEHAGRKYTAEDKARWRDLARCPDLMLHSKRCKAILIARREALPAGAAETIRRSI